MTSLPIDHQESKFLLFQWRATKNAGRNKVRQRILLIVFVGLLADAAGMAAKFSAREIGNDVVLGNKYLELRLERKGDQVTARALVNRITRRTIGLSADDFALHFEGQPSLHAADFALRHVRKESIPAGQRLRLQFAQRDGTSQVAVVYELLDQDSFLRRHLEYSPALPQPLRQVEVWRVGLAGECSSQEIGPPEYMRYNVWSVDDKRGFGQPVLLLFTLSLFFVLLQPAKVLN